MGPVALDELYHLISSWNCPIQSFAHLFSEVLDHMLTVQVNEGIANDLGHRLDCRCVSPIRVVHRSKGDAIFLFVSEYRFHCFTHPALQCSQQHMGRVETVNEVWRKSRRLSQRRDFIRLAGIRDVYRLKRGHDLLFDLFAVWLYDRKTERCGPNNRSHALL